MMQQNRAVVARRYTVALASVALATLIRLPLEHYLRSDVPFTTYFLAVAFTAWYGGAGPALASVGLSALAAAQFVMPPTGALLVTRTADWLAMGLFLAVGSAIALLSGALHRARAVAEAHALRHRMERERFFVTLASIGDGVIVTDTSGRVTYLNAVAEGLTGWKLDEADGQPLETVFRIFNETTRQAAENPARRALHSGKIVGLANHTVLIARGGDERAIDDSAAPIREPSGQMIGVVLVFRDVTAKRRMEIERSRLAALVESADDAVMGLDVNGMINTWNAGAVHLYEYQPQEVVGKHLSACIVPSDQVEELQGLMRRLLEGEPIHHFATIRTTKSGKPIDVSISMSAVFDSAGEVIGFSAIDRDITPQRFSQRRRAARLAATQVFAQEQDVDRAIEQVLERLCRVLGWHVACFWSIDPHQERLRCERVWHTEDDQLAAFAQACRSNTFDQGASLPGRVWETREPVWVEQIADERNFQRTREALEGGLQAAFACPVTVGKDFLGVVEFFNRDSCPLEEPLLEVIDTIAHQLGNFMERRWIEQQLARNEHELSEFFDSAAVGIHWVGPDGTILRVNQTELDLLGYTREEYIGRNITEFHADQEAVDSILQRLHEGEDIRDAPAKLRCKDGSIKHVLVDSNVHWENDQFVHTRCFTRDVTDRKKAEDALRESESQFRMLANSIPQLAWMARPDGHIFWYNDRWYDFTGTTFQQMEGWGWEQVHDPEELPRVTESWTGALASGEPWDDTFPLRRHDGEMRWHLSRAVPLRDEEGNLVRWFGTNTDITERRRNESTLRFLADASESLSALVDYKSTLQKLARLAVPEFADWCAVDIVDSSGVPERLAIAHVDPKKVELVHRLSEQFPADPRADYGISKVLRTGEPDLMSDVSGAFLSKIASAPAHMELLRTLGLRSYMVVPLKVHGKVEGTLAFISAEPGRHYEQADLSVATDLAHRASIAIENARLYEQVREADRRKDEFLAMLAHELRNPLGPIQSGLEVLALDEDDDNETVRIMREQLAHVVRLVDDLLDVSRIMRGKTELRKSSVDLVSVVQQASDAVRWMIKNRNQQFVVSVPEGPIWLHADPVRLVQVLENLLNNASKYTDEKGRIELEITPEEHFVSIVVRDTGIGIEPELLPRVFDLFTQSSRTLDRAQGGLGIGLTLVRSLVEMHGGSINARSEGTGTGSEFRVRLPIQRTAPRSPEGRPHAQAAQRLRILVVDDNVAAVRLLALLLTKLGDHQVEVAYDGDSALAKLEGYQPDLVLLDIGLPGMDGYEVARTIRTRSGPPPRLPPPRLLVALTGYGQHEDRQKSKAAGFDEHLVKPLTLADIEKLLTHPALSGDRSAAAAGASRIQQVEVVTTNEPSPESPDGSSRKSTASVDVSQQSCSAFFRELVHEIGNAVLPLRLMQQIAELNDTDTAKLAQIRTMFEQHIPTLQELADRVRQVSRAAQQDLTPDFASIDLAQIVEQAVESVQPLMEERQQTLRLDPLPSPMRYNGDDELLQEAFAELLENAALYSGTGGTVSLSGRQNDDGYVFRLRDTGPGVAPELAPHVFDLFVRGDREIDFSTGRLGVGLTRVRRILDVHGGYIELDSNNGQPGAEFVVHLPRRSADRADSATPQPLERRATDS
ncbi:MAG: PAS domain S-box protein [Pirellulales bacterium]